MERGSWRPDSQRNAPRNLEQRLDVGSRLRRLTGQKRRRTTPTSPTDPSPAYPQRRPIIETSRTRRILKEKERTGDQSASALSQASAKDSSMQDDGTDPLQQVQVPAALRAHEDARALIRLVQCYKCSKPFQTPVTLPCGHSCCKTCLPPTFEREGISYPASQERSIGVGCEYEGCGAEHAMADVNDNIALSKVMQAVVEEMNDFVSTMDVAMMAKLPIHVQERKPDGIDPEMWQMRIRRPTWERHGGNLYSTYSLALVGDLPYDMELNYVASTPDLSRQADTQLLNRIRDRTFRELDCQICYSLMLDPVTTPCGHTFCRKCLARVLDHSNHCAMCRRQLRMGPGLTRQPGDKIIINLLDNLCPEMVAARAMEVVNQERGNDPDTNVPVFVCTLSFPNMPTFLHIFEPRYRLMVRRAWEGNRQFGMIMYNRSRQPQGDMGVTSFMEYGTMLEILNIEYMPDGRSYIETRGISRFRVRSHGMLDGYMTANIDRIDDLSLPDEERLEATETSAAAHAMIANPDGSLPPGHPNELDVMPTSELLERAIRFIERMRALSADWLSQRIITAYGGPPTDPAHFPYWFACVLPIAEDEKYVLLRTRSVRERLKIVNHWIRRIEAQRWFSASVCTVV